MPIPDLPRMFGTDFKTRLTQGRIERQLNHKERRELFASRARRHSSPNFGGDSAQQALRLCFVTALASYDLG